MQMAQKEVELGVQMEADLSTDVEMQEPPTVASNLTPVDQTSNVISGSIQKSIEDDDIIEMHSTESKKEHMLSSMKPTPQEAHEPVTDSKSLQRIKLTRKVAYRSETYAKLRKIESRKQKEIITYSSSLQGITPSANSMHTLNSNSESAAVTCPASVSSSIKINLPQSHVPESQDLIQEKETGKDNSNLLEEINELKVEKAKLEEALIQEKEINAKNSNLLGKITELKAEIAKLENKLFKQKEKKDKANLYLVQEIDKLKNENKILIQVKKDDQKVNFKLLREIAILKKEKAKFEKDLNKDKESKKISNLLEEINRLKDEKAQLKKEQNELKEEKVKVNSCLVSEIMKLKNEIVQSKYDKVKIMDLEKKVEKQIKEIEEKIKLISHLFAEIAELETKLVQSTNEKVKFEVLSNKLASSCADLQEQVKELRLAVETRESAISYLQKYDYSLKEEIQHLKEALKKSEIETVKLKLIPSKNNTIKVDKKCEEIKKNVRELSSKFCTLDTKVQNLEDKLSHYKTVSVDMEEQSANLEEDLSLQNSVIQNCSEKLRSLESQLLEIEEEQMDDSNVESEKSLFVQGQSLLNEKEDRKLDTVLIRDSQRLNVLEVPCKQDTKDVTGTRALHKLSQNTNTLQVSSSIPLGQESSSFSQDSSAIVVSQHNKSGIKSFQKTSDVINDINISLGITYTAEDCSTPSAVSRDSYTQPLDFSTFQDLSTTKKLSNAAEYSAATDKVQQPRELVKVTKKISQPLPDIYADKTDIFNTVFTRSNISGRKIIELEYFLKMLKIVNQHSEFRCSLNDIIITNERKFGLIMFYDLKCRVCDYQINLCSENPSTVENVNADAIAGMLSINSNLDDMNKLLLNMKLTPISRNIFIKEYEKKFYPKENFPIIQSVCSENFGKSLEYRPLDAAFQVSTFSEETYSKTGKESRKNISQQPKSFTDLILDSSGSDKSFGKKSLSNVKLIIDQFEVEEERDDNMECEEKSEVILPPHILKVPNNKLVADEDHTLLDVTKIKQEIDLDMHENELAVSETNVIEMQNNNNVERMMIS